MSIVFAQTEASPVITQTSPQDSVQDRAHTLGRPLPQTQVKIVDVALRQHARNSRRPLATLGITLG